MCVIIFLQFFTDRTLLLYTTNLVHVVTQENVYSTNNQECFAFHWKMIDFSVRILFENIIFFLFQKLKFEASSSSINMTSCTFLLPMLECALVWACKDLIHAIIASGSSCFCENETYNSSVFAKTEFVSV